jgi:hypothetical protein
MSNSYRIGSVPRLQATFAVNGTPTDPSVIVFKIRVPNGAITTYLFSINTQLVKTATGVYYVDWPTTAEGIHAWRFEGTGACVAVEEQEFHVLGSEVV